jgi:1,4-dihydroxy-2-naphthoate octaprenyltransferase
MTNQPSSNIRPSTQNWGLKLKTFLTTMMSVLSLLVVLLGGMQKDVLWLWIGFVCCLISGVFIQLFITHIKNDAASGRR